MSDVGTGKPRPEDEVTVRRDERDDHDEDLGVFLQRLRNLAEDWRNSDEFIGIVIRSRWPQRYDLDD